MKKFFSLLTLALLTLSVGATTYTHTFASGQLKTKAGTVTLSGVEWTQTAATFIGFDTSDYEKGVQVGSSKNPTTSFSLSTDGITGTITSITVNSSIAKDGDAKMTVKVGEEQWGETTDLVLDATDYTFTGEASGRVEISYTATAKAFYIKSITIVYEGGEVPPEPAVAAPVFNPNGGNFTGSQEVTLTCATENASIYYWVGEQDAVAEWIYYKEPFYVTETTTYTAVATKGDDISDYTTVTFTKKTPQCAKPKFTPANGTTFMQGEELDVTINCDTEGATIKYALNDGEFQNYSAPIHLTETTTIKAVASAEGYIDSDEATATYTMVVPETTGPIFNLVTDVTTLAAGDRIILVNTAEDGTAVAMGAAKTNNFGSVDVVVNGNKVQTEKANIITLEKSGDNWNLKAAEGYLYAASSSSNHMKAEETVDENGNANAAISIADNAASIVFQGTNSHNNLRYNPNNGTPLFSCYEAGKQNPVYIYKTTEDVPEPPVTEVAAPVFTPEKNTVFDKNLGLEISINCETEGATIYYSTDNETFDAYNAPFTIFETTTVKAYAKLGEFASDTVYAKYNAAVMVYDLEEANALDNKTNFYFQGDAVVTYKNGKNLWIRDEKGSGLIFGNTIASGEFKTGDVLNKGWDAQKYNYGSDGYEKFIPEFQYPNNVKASGVTQTVEPAVYSTITTDNVNEYILMKNQTLTEMKNADGLVFFNKFNIDLNIEDGKAYDIVGIVTIYHDEPQVYIISATEVSSQTLVGDVDEDGNVNITDVTALIDMLLSDNTKPSGDVNGDGQINITDVTDLIDILLKN